MEKTKKPWNAVVALTKTGRHTTALWAMLFLMAFLGTTRAAVFWDPAQNATGPSDGSGNWDDTTVSNWLNSANLTFTVSTNWAATGSNVIIGAGVPGSYFITNLATVNANTLTFSNANGYTIQGGQLTINVAATTPGVISLSNTTNTIAAPYRINGADITNAPNTQLTFTGGGFGTANPRFLGTNQANTFVTLAGDGTVTTYSQAAGGTIQPSGITLNISNAILKADARVDIARNQANSSSALSAGTVNVLRGGQLNVNTGANSTDGGRHLQISRGAPATLNVYPGGLVTTLAVPSAPNVSQVGKLRLVPDSNSQGTLNVLGGDVLVGPGTASGTPGSYAPSLVQLTIWDANPGLNANSRAIVNLSSGTITADAIAFTAPASAATANPTNSINVSGGTLYLGGHNIVYPGGLGANFAINLSGGTVSAIANWSPACSAPINLTNVNGSITFQAADTNGSPFDMAFSGPLTGVGGFNKTGGGKLTLSGANNYSGATVVANGTLVMDTTKSPTSGSVSVQALNSVAIASGQSWTINGNLTYDSGSPTADFNYGTALPSTAIPAIQVNGNLAFNITPQLTVGGSDIPVGVFPLIKYTGSLSGTVPTTVVINQNNTSGYVSNDLAHQTIALVVTGSPVKTPLKWAVGSGTWNFVTPNWNNNGLSVAYADPASVQFDDTASGPFPITVTVANTVHPTNVTVISTANSYTIAGPGVIAGGEGLLKSGGGALTLSGANTYSGGTTISGGILNINYGGDGATDSAIGTGPLTLNGGVQLGNTSGGTINLLTPIPSYWNGSWTFAGANDLNLGTAPVALSNGIVVLTVVTNTLTVNGQISESIPSSIQKLGNGTLTLSNLNSFTGGMDLEAGTLNINSDGAVGSGQFKVAGGAIDNTSGATVVLNSAPSAIVMSGTFTFLGTTNLDFGSTQVNVVGATLNVSNNTLLIEGPLLGASTSLTKNGRGAITLGGSATTGSVGFIVNEGTLNLDRAAGFFAVNTAGLTVNSNGTAVIVSPTGTQLNTAALTLNGGLLELNGSSETIGNSTFNSGILRDSNPTAATLNVAAGFTLALAGVADFDITNGATLTISNTVGGTSNNAVLLKTGAGTLVVLSNTYAGNTTVSNGTLSLAYPNLSTNSTVAIAAGATLNLNFTNNTSGADTNIVAALVLNGANAVAGLHNSTTDPAYITGSGSLLVVPQATINPHPGTILVSSSGNTLSLAWPTNAGWLLQAQTNSIHTGLGTTWVTVAGSDSVTNLNVSINPANGATFYRLVHP